MESSSWQDEVQLSFRNGVSLLVNDSSRQVTLRWQRSDTKVEVDLGLITPGLLSALRKLTCGGATERDLMDLVRKADGFLSLQRLSVYLTKFEKASLICRTMFNNGEPLLSLVPNSPHYKFQPYDLFPEQKYLLSRFAYWHRVHEQMVLESPLGFAQIILESGQAVMLISKMMKPQSCQALANCASTISLQAITSVFNLLLNAGLLSPVDEAGQPQEDKDEVLRQWEFHDLLFHSQSRFGRSLAGLGRTYRFLGEIQPLPAVKPQMSHQFIPLYRPDIEQLKEDDLSFTQVMERRKSLRSYGEKPITDRQLGEFLYRVGRVREFFEEQPNSRRPEKYQLSRRPYPSGGATYALELYITIDRCENIPSGFYHYCPLEHKLYKVSERNSLVDKLLRIGRPDPYQSHDPQVLITIAARFQRVSWKYQAIAYALLLKECGILSQSMNLVATAMGLAPCIIGVGDADLFAQLAGTNYYAETCIGEFALGSTPTQREANDI